MIWQDAPLVAGSILFVVTTGMLFFDRNTALRRRITVPVALTLLMFACLYTSLGLYGKGSLDLVQGAFWAMIAVKRGPKCSS